MKIISGRFKSRILCMPKDIRPTSDKVRGAVFEILKDRMEGARFLDLYCGSGAIGVEAFSRGASKVSFVDNDFKCIKALKKNLASLDILDLSSIDIYKKNVLKALREFETKSMSFDVIFLDPPYYKDIAKNTLIGLTECDILARNAIIVAEAYKKEALPDEIGLLRKIRTRKYGDTKLEFYCKL
ncbi:16S rRNA (guanine(966)-N(2))-methyltransferase RsmD [Candidatus Omnitrophota bacterium]